MANGAPVPGLSGGWVDNASKLIIQVGFPTVVAGVLLWFLLGRFQDNMLAITKRMEANTAVAERLLVAIDTETHELQKQTGEIQQQTAAIRSIEHRQMELWKQKGGGGQPP